MFFQTYRRKICPIDVDLSHDIFTVQTHPIMMAKHADYEKVKILEDVDYFVKTIYSDAYLDFEFFKTSRNLLVSITDIINNVVYKEIINTAETFHLIINIENWDAGPYTISIKNNKGLFIIGHFLLR